MWVLTDLGRLVRIDPATNKVVGIMKIPEGASAVRATPDALWITYHRSGALRRLDPRTLKTVATIPVGAGPQFLAVGEGAIWTLNQPGGNVTRVDPETNRAVTTIEVDAGSISGGDIAVGGGFVWARVTRGLVTKVDPRDNTVVATYQPASGSGSVAADANTAWITAHDSDSIFRLPLG